MTKNKARKATVRARAAVTGERYVVARRAIEQEPVIRRWGIPHRLTHRLPGVPAHIEGGLVVRRNRPHPPKTRITRQQGNAHHGDPWVLVGWQNRIARLVGTR